MNVLHHSGWAVKTDLTVFAIRRTVTVLVETMIVNSNHTDSAALSLPTLRLCNLSFHLCSY